MAAFDDKVTSAPGRQAPSPARIGNQLGHGLGRAGMTGVGAAGGAIAGNNVRATTKRLWSATASTSDSTMAARGPSSARTSATSTSATGAGSTPTTSAAPEPAGVATSPGRIRVGVGGWVYEPWRDNFYPAGLARTRELEYLSRRVTAIEINATYYRTQSAASFAKWRDATPDDFVFAVKATRYATNRRVLGEAGESIERFVASGLAELGPKLGPIVWQFATTKAFDADDFAAFLKLLPARLGSTPLRHVMEVRHPSFMAAEYISLARRHGVATVFADSDDYPSFSDVTGDFVYARLMRCESACETGYPAPAIAAWAERARTWRAGGEAAGLPRVEAAAARAAARDVFMLFISGAKERAPAAAVATLAALGLSPPAD